MHGDITNPFPVRNFQKYAIVKVRPNFLSHTFFGLKKTKSHPPNLKTLIYHLRKNKITAMEKDKSIKIEPTREQSLSKIEQITSEVSEVREGLRVEISTVVYKAATAMFDEDLTSKMTKKKDIEIEREELGKKLDMLP